MVTDLQQVPTLDYSALDADTLVFVQELDTELDLVLKRTTKETGLILLKAKDGLPHGLYMSWIASKGISQPTAWRCMQVAQGKELKSFKMNDLAIEVEDQEELPTMKSPVLTALQSSESNEWFTPAIYIEAARELMHRIDVDPASCEEANKIVKAKQFYTQEDNGLMKPWDGRIWLNPPYGVENGVSNQELWTRTLIERFTINCTVTEAVLLVNANVEAKWFQPLYEYLICLTNHRIRFYNTSGDANQPTQGNALVYFGKDRKQQNRFIELFSRFGNVVERARMR